MRSGSSSRPSASRSRSSASRRDWRRRCRRSTSTSAGELGVALRHLEQAPLGAALRTLARRPAAPRRAASAAASSAPLSSSGTITCGRQWRRRPVVLEQELLDHVLRLAARRVVDVERLPVDQRRRRARGTPEVGPGLALIQADHVERLGALDARRLPLAARGAPPRDGRAAAPPSRTAAPPTPPPCRARCRVRPRPAGRAGTSTTWAITAMYSSRVTRPSHGASERLMKYCRQGDPLDLPGLLPLALAVGEDAADELERVAHLAGARVGAEVEVAGHVAAAHEAHPRPLVGDRDLDVRVALVVAQTQVVRRPGLLDEVVLEEQGLGLAGGHHPLDVARPGDHLGDAPGRRRPALAQVRRRRACAASFALPT